MIATLKMRGNRPPSTISRLRQQFLTPMLIPQGGDRRNLNGMNAHAPFPTGLSTPRVAPFTTAGDALAAALRDLALSASPANADALEALADEVQTA